MCVCVYTIKKKKTYFLISHCFGIIHFNAKYLFLLHAFTRQRNFYHLKIANEMEEIRFPKNAIADKYNSFQ